MEQNQIEKHTLNYFILVFGTSNTCTLNGIIREPVSKMSTNEDNEYIDVTLSANDIRDTMFDMNGVRPHIPDGFGGHLYQAY